MPPNWSFVERERAKRVLSDRDAQQRRGGIIILLSATMWHHIRADEGVSAASAAQSAPRPCSVHNRGRRSHIHPERKTPAAATVDPDQVRRSLKGSKLPPEPLTSEREPAVGAARVFVLESSISSSDSTGRRNRALVEAFTRSRGFPDEERREQKKRGAEEPRRVWCGASSASPPHARFGGCFYLSVLQFHVRGSHGCSDLPERVSEGFQTFN